MPEVSAVIQLSGPLTVKKLKDMESVLGGFKDTAIIQHKTDGSIANSQSDINHLEYQGLNDGKLILRNT